MWNPFIWLSGADRSVIDLCVKHKLYEKIKFSGIGTLVLIPAVVGFFSMSYAISTVAAEPWMYFGGGAVWGFIVLAIDRLLVSTTNKSELKPYSLVSIVARYVLALFLGMAVAHPLVLRWFNESIEQRLERNRDNEIGARRQSGEGEKKVVGLGPLAAQIQEKTTLRSCMQQLLTNEQSGMDSELPCGSTREKSGAGCDVRCQNIKAQITLLTKEIGVLETRAVTEETQRSDSISSINTATVSDITRIEDRFSKDYLARVDALAELQNGNPERGELPKPHVWWVGWFIMLFFMILDIVPITLKLAIPMGEYEMVRDTQLDEMDSKQVAERVAFRAHASTVYQTTVQSNLDTNSRMDGIAHVTKMTMDFIRQQEKGRVEFNRKLDEIRSSIASIKDDERRTKYAAYITRIKETFDMSLDKALTQFLELIKGL